MASERKEPGRIQGEVEGAAAMVAMGGYNTFCEILSFDKPSLLIPRSQPRREQLIRAQRAEELGLASMLNPELGSSTDAMVTALQRLASQHPPSAAGLQGLLNGAEAVANLVDQRLVQGTAQYPIHAQGA